MFILKESTKQYLSQKFRNFRRVSMPHKPLSNPKLVTAANILPVEASVTQSPSAVDCHTDTFAYDRNTKTLLDEWKDKSYDYVFQLLKVTHTLRRQAINSSDKSTIALAKDYPYFADDNYVSASLYSFP